MSEPEDGPVLRPRNCPRRWARRRFDRDTHRPKNPYDVLRIGRKQPRFFLNEEGQRAHSEYTEWLNAQAQFQIDDAVNEASLDARYFALRRAKQADSGKPFDAVVGSDREAIALVMQMRSAERVGQSLTRATNVLALATIGLFIATIVLVIVTVVH